MNPILEMLMNSGGGAGVQQIGQQFGLSESQTNAALGMLVPAVMAGVQRNTSQEGGMGDLLGALTGGNHSKYLDDPEILSDQRTTEDGNSILGHIFGSKDASRGVANHVSATTGISAEILKQMLPVVAAMVMGGLSKRTQTTAAAAPSGLDAGGLLGSLLDQNHDGSIMDDVTGMLGRFMR